MQSELQVILTQTRDQKPLAVVCNLPGLDADMTPAQMRALAYALCAAANECEARPMDEPQFKRVSRGYPLAPQTEESEANAHDVPILPEAVIEAAAQKRAARRLARQQAPCHERVHPDDFPCHGDAPAPLSRQAPSAAPSGQETLPDAVL